MSSNTAAEGDTHNIPPMAWGAPAPSRISTLKVAIKPKFAEYISNKDASEYNDLNLEVNNQCR